MRSPSRRASPIPRRCSSIAPRATAPISPRISTRVFRAASPRAQGVAAVAQPAGRRGALRTRPRQFSGPTAWRRRRDRAAEGRAGRPRGRPRRPRHFAGRSRPALCRSGARRRSAGTERAARRAAVQGSAPRHRPGRRLVCRGHFARRAAAAQRAVRPHRVQDRHVLRLPRRAGDRLRPRDDRRRLGGTARTTARRPA